MNTIRRQLTVEETKQVKGDAALTLTSVLTYMVVAILVSVCYSFFKSNKGQLGLPGGFTFTWGK